jgi:hypothetical protein
VFHSLPFFKHHLYIFKPDHHPLGHRTRMGHTVAAAAAAAELALGFTKPNAVEPPQVCLLHRGPRIRCSSSWLVSPCRQVDKDCELLEAERIMDYSLLVGIHFKDRCKDKLKRCMLLTHAWSCKMHLELGD